MLRIELLSGPTRNPDFAKVGDTNYYSCVRLDELDVFGAGISKLIHFFKEEVCRKLIDTLREVPNHPQSLNLLAAKMQVK